MQRKTCLWLLLTISIVPLFKIYGQSTKNDPAPLPILKTNFPKLRLTEATFQQFRVKHLHNFSDSVYTVALPPHLDQIFRCDVYAKFEAEAAKIQIKPVEKTPPKIKKEIAPIDLNCKEGVVLSENVVVDSRYFFGEEYYYVWDSLNVDPYPFKLKNFKEPVSFHLFSNKSGKAWQLPLESTEVNSKFGARWYRWHHGIDLDLNIGDPVYAVADGVVRIAKYNRRGYGYYVMLRHENGLETLYAHLKEYWVKPGQEVKAGEQIGLGGNTGRSTGPHLHFEIRYRGYAFNPNKVYNFQNGFLLKEHFTLKPQHYQNLLASTQSRYHQIRPGESLWIISRKYRTSINQLCRLNGINRRTTLRIGRRLRVR